MSTRVRVDVQDAVAHVRLDRPAEHNALGSAMILWLGGMKYGTASRAASPMLSAALPTLSAAPATALDSMASLRFMFIRNQPMTRTRARPMIRATIPPMPPPLRRSTMVGAGARSFSVIRSTRPSGCSTVRSVDMVFPLLCGGETPVRPIRFLSPRPPFRRRSGRRS
jgi:hypothetical protein